MPLDTLFAILILALGATTCAAVCWANLVGQHDEACRPAGAGESGKWKVESGAASAREGGQA